MIKSGGIPPGVPVGNWKVIGSAVKAVPPIRAVALAVTVCVQLVK
jgi:hypothetical protein